MVRRRPGWGPGASPALGRRGALALTAALPLLVAAGGEPEVLRPRKARFEEVGDAVFMTIGLPELLLTADTDAMTSLEAGFATTLTYEISVFRAREREPVERHRVVVLIRGNMWKDRYEVTVEEPGRGAAMRSFTGRDEAIAAAVTLERLRIITVGELERGQEATYHATVIGHRNPIERGLLSGPGGEQRRAGSTFSRWLGIFLRVQQRAEKTVAIKTVPAFYLVPR